MAWTVVQAATGSSWTDGTSGNATPWVLKNCGIHSVRCPTTSRAVQPVQGEAFSHASGVTPRTRSVNCWVMRS